LICFLNAGIKSWPLRLSRALVCRGLCTLDGSCGGFTFAFLKNKSMGSRQALSKSRALPARQLNGVAAKKYDD
jgi:hypothetical protein